ncbi:unnamed protein product [Strongylus vulgaris]|uniref:Uncharacterized protein n=1 Tax=Strongylus vulgaris TaxID=40348 RepID=A0A3P7JB96_STRVU|nr:unnamed protein product [Strongylus vulgaris]
MKTGIILSFAHHTRVNPIIPTGDIPPRDLPAKVCAAIQTMEAATAPGPDHVSADLLRTGAHRPHENLRNI